MSSGSLRGLWFIEALIESLLGSAGSREGAFKPGRRLVVMAKVDG